jgi:hypothetical protein
MVNPDLQLISISAHGSWLKAHGFTWSMVNGEYLRLFNLSTLNLNILLKIM